MQAPRALTDRQFGLDWLRIGAFGILIFYHIGMFFVPWEWHVKTAEPVEWVQWPMLAVSPWRLSLLFLISGIVSRTLIRKLASPSKFAGSRSRRLLIPLAAGMIIFVAPQPWIELRDNGTYSSGFLHFWLNDYAEFGASRGMPLPTWMHLWFVAYLWAYSMILAVAALLPSRARSGMQQAFDRLFAGWRLFVLPISGFFAARLFLFPQFGETHAFLDDAYAHAVYSFAFFFGFGLARSTHAWETIIQNWKLSLATAVLAFGLTFFIRIAGTDAEPVAWLIAATRAVLAWSAILGLLGAAQTHFHHDGPVRRYLAEAIFPYYIVHQTIIIVVGYYLKQFSLGTLLEFVVILASTVLGCALTYETARRIWWLRPILGLKGQQSAAPAVRSAGMPEKAI